MTVRNLRELRDMSPGVERVKAADEYIRERETAIREARAIRDADIRSLISEYGPAEAARRAGMSLSTIKLIRGRA